MNGLVQPEEVCVLFHQLARELRLSISLTTSMKYFSLFVYHRVVALTFSQLIVTQEFARCGCRGYADGMSYTHPFGRQVEVLSQVFWLALSSDFLLFSTSAVKI